MASRRWILVPVAISALVLPFAGRGLATPGRFGHRDNASWNVPSPLRAGASLQIGFPKPLRCQRVCQRKPA